MDYISTYNYVKELFDGDVDKGGSPYIGHLERVSQKCVDVSEDASIIGLLHDVCEDKGVKATELMDKGYSLNVVNSVMDLTRDEGISYEDYISNLLKEGSLDALYVKKADLEDNMNLGRLLEIKEKDVKRIECRYIPAWRKVVKAITDLEAERNI